MPAGNIPASSGSNDISTASSTASTSSKNPINKAYTSFSSAASAPSTKSLVSPNASQMRQTIVEILEWRQPMRSAQVVAGVVATGAILFWLGRSWKTCLLCGAAMIIGCGAVWSKVLGRKPSPGGIYITKEQMVELEKFVLGQGNQAVDYMIHVFYWTDVRKSVAAVVGLLAANVVFSYLSIFTLLFLGLTGVLLRKPVVDLYNKRAKVYVQPHIDQGKKMVDQFLTNLPPQLRPSKGKKL